MAFEDSDSDDFGALVKKTVPEPPSAEKKVYTVLPELPNSPKPEEVDNSPPRYNSLSKTPSVQYVPNAAF